MSPLASEPAAGLLQSRRVSLSAADAESWAITSSTCLCWATQAPVIYRPPRAAKACWSLWDSTDSVSFHYTNAAPSNLIFREENYCFSFVLLRHFSWVIKLQKLSTQLSCLFRAAHIVLWSAGSVSWRMSVYLTLSTLNRTLSIIYFLCSVSIARPDLSRLPECSWMQESTLTSLSTCNDILRCVSDPSCSSYCLKQVRPCWWKL